jgi:TetR/AcrR family transcriptional repressor of lmrAB and yxaGH operons
VTALAAARRTATYEPAPTRERLLAAAIRLFQERGYHGAGLTEILAAAQAPKGSLYHHFPGGKPELAVVAIARIAADWEASVARRRARGASAADVIRGLARAQARWLRETQWRQASLFASLAQGFIPEAPVVRQTLARHAARRHTRVAQMLAEDGIADAAGVAALAVAALDGGLLEARVQRDVTPLLAAAACAARLAERSR